MRIGIDVGGTFKEAVYDFEVDNPPPMIPRYLRKGIIERVNSKGQVVVPLDEDSVYEAVDLFKEETKVLRAQAPGKGER